MAIYFPTTSITTSGSNNLQIPGSIIQVVDNQSTVSSSATTSAWVNLLTTSITLTNASNKVLVEYFMNDRSDQGNGAWCLTYHRILRDATQVMYSGFNGATANFIGFYKRSFIDTPGSAGTFNYTASALAYQGTVWLGNNNSGSTNHYLRLYEIGV